MSYDVICPQCHGEGRIETPKDPSEALRNMSFVPINHLCYGCGEHVAKNARQDITFDNNGACRRVCEMCINHGFYEGKIEPKG